MCVCVCVCVCVRMQVLKSALAGANMLDSVPASTLDGSWHPAQAPNPEGWGYRGALTQGQLEEKAPISAAQKNGAGVKDKAEAKTKDGSKSGTDKKDKQGALCCHVLAQLCCDSCFVRV